MAIYKTFCWVIDLFDFDFVWNLDEEDEKIINEQLHI